MSEIYLNKTGLDKLAEVIADKFATKAEVPAALPTTTTAGQVLKSTSTAGTVEWGSAAGGTATDVQIDSTSITSNNVANIKTMNSNYNASSNKIATASDLTGKQNTIDSSHKLSADLVTDASTTNKFINSNSVKNVFGLDLSSSGEIKGKINTGTDYTNMWNDAIVSKGTLEGVIANKQDALPTTTTAGQVLKSTSTAGTLQWGSVTGGGNVSHDDTVSTSIEPTLLSSYYTKTECNNLFAPAQNEYSLSFQSSSNGTTTNIVSGTAYQNFSDRPLLVVLFYDTDINSNLNVYSGFSISVGSSSANALIGFDNANNQTKYRAVRSANANINSSIMIQCVVPPKYYFVMACWGGSSQTANQSGQNLQARFLKL